MDIQHVAALNQPFWPRDITAITTKTITNGLSSGGLCQTHSKIDELYPNYLIIFSTVVVTPLDTFQLLFFALFGLTQPADLRMETAQPEWTLFLYKTVFGFYVLVTNVVLINMLIAMMSDTYQRIQVRLNVIPNESGNSNRSHFSQAQSDIEWKFGLAKLVRAMDRTAATPSPLNLFTSWIGFLYQLARSKGKTVLEMLPHD